MSVFQYINGLLLPISGFQIADSKLNTTSEQPIQNAAVANAVNAVNEYGCKNLCVYPYTNTTGVTNGITWTDIGDGTVTASGKISSGQTYSSFTGSYTTINTAGTYIFTGCPADGSDSTYYINVSVDGTSVGHDTGNGLQLTLTAGQVVSFGIAILDTVTTFSNLTFRPMIRDSRFTNADYVPFAMSNRDITDAIIGSSSAFVKNSNYSWLTISNQKAVKIGSLLVLSLTFSVTNTQNLSDTWIGITTSDFRPESGNRCVGTICVNNSTETIGTVNLSYSGYLFITGNLQASKEYSLTVVGC